MNGRENLEGGGDFQGEREIKGREQRRSR